MPEDEDGYNAWTRYPASILQRLREAYNWLKTQQPVLNRTVCTLRLITAIHSEASHDGCSIYVIQQLVGCLDALLKGLRGSSS
ncbi:hypothetical protein AOLI_G00271620 [Acnodon oligacanthus]